MKFRVRSSKFEVSLLHVQLFRILRPLHDELEARAGILPHQLVDDAIRVERRTGARVAFQLKKGEKVTAVNGVVVTIRAGRVEFSQPQDIDTADGRIRVAPGQTLYLLTYEGEGYTKAWFNGRLYRSVDTQHFYNGVCDFNPGRCTGKIVEKGQVEWWVQIRNATGRVGWTDEPEAFDGKNAIGGTLQN